MAEPRRSHLTGATLPVRIESLRRYVTMRVVRAGGDLYVRSADGPDAYHAKYDSYGPSIVGNVVGPDAHLVTVRLVASETTGTHASSTSTRTSPLTRS